MQRLGIVHTVSQLAPTFAELAAELLPGVETTVITDELLLKRTVRDGAVDEVTRDRLRGHVAALAGFGVDAVLVTCSSVGGVVDEVASGADVPVLRIDRAMAERAVTLGSSVGVLATLPTTLAPTTQLVEATAREAGRAVKVVSRLCDGAFAALERGDRARHDAIITEELDRLAAQVDVVVLAQASMARIAAARLACGTRVLSSPRLAMEHLAGTA
jgi:Asp/Glu/hydantoin racemase